VKDWNDSVMTLIKNEKLINKNRRENEQAIKKQETILIKPKKPIKKATTRRNQEICVSESLVSPSFFP
jgi:hypothetical protein